MHKFLRAVGFSKLQNKKQLQELLAYCVKTADEKLYTSGDDNIMISQYHKHLSENFGITICGEYDENNRFTMDYYFPYGWGNAISSYEDISIERHAEKESYAGVCDDIRIGVSLIFFLQNFISYLKVKNANRLPIKGTSLIFNGLSTKGMILMPINKNESDKKRDIQATKVRNELIAAARKGDEDAIESLSLDDIDTFTTISKKLQTEDVLTLVDTYFMPYGIECDQYSIMGEIVSLEVSKNKMTNEEVYEMTVKCNDMLFEIFINKLDLYGEPKIGRRLKAFIWLQGIINFPD